MKNVDKSLADYAEALRLDPKGRSGLLQSEQYHLARGRSRTSDRRRQPGHPAGPEDALAYANRSAGYTRKGDYEAGIADAKEALRLDPTNSVAQTDLNACMPARETRAARRAATA